MTSTIPTLSLKTISLPQIQFNPLVYKPEEPDANLLANSLQQRETRMNNAAQAKASFDEGKAKLFSLINPNEQKWFSDFIGSYEKKINDSIAAGDFGEATRMGTMFASEIKSKPEMLGRIKAQAEYQKAIEDLYNRKDISQTTKKRFSKDIMKYNYTDTYDDNGNIIGGVGVENINQLAPVSDINLNDIAYNIIKQLVPNVTSTERGGSDDHTEKEDDKAYRRGSKWSRSNTIKSVSPERLETAISEYIRLTPDAEKAIKQNYDNKLFDLNELKQNLEKLKNENGDINQINDLEDQINIAEKEVYKNGSPVSYKTYFTDFVKSKVLVDTLSYKQISDTKSNDKTNIELFGSSGGSSGGFSGGQEYPYYGKGPVVAQTGNLEKAVDDINENSKEVMNMFNNK